MMTILLALQAAAAPVDEDQRLARLAALYEEICLKTFPDDKAVEAAMTVPKARELSPEEVKVTMRDDPARGWQLMDERATVWVEFPPFHACSVRWSANRLGDIQPYRVIADKHTKAVGGFSPMKPMETDQGPIHIHGIGEARPLPNGGAETLFFIDQSINDPKRRAAGETGVVLRFVHQFAPPPPPGAK